MTVNFAEFKICVIFPIFNEETILTETIKEVLQFSQKRPDFQFVFVNDGSTDKTQHLWDKNLDGVQIRPQQRQG